MNIAIYGHAANFNESAPVQVLFDKLKETGVGVMVHTHFIDFLRENFSLDENIQTFSTHEDIKGKVDYLFSLGGDGTLLETISLIRNSGIPILGINTGRLGFLASVAKEEINESLDLLFDKKYSLDKRTLLQLNSKENHFGSINYALNEVTVHKNDSASMITIHTYLDGEFLNSYWADGLIIATPTGSTAYSLSCGGPIVLPGSKNFTITPIAPHNLNVRPMVISDDSIIKLKIEGRTDSFMLSLDSRSKTIETNVELELKQENFTINLLNLENQNFLSTIRNKLLWGLDKRN